MKTRRAQEEIVGFAVIILLVIVIGVVLFVISFNKSSSGKTSLEVSDFLYSSFLYSVDCQQQIENINDLILACYKNEQCDNESSCQLLEDTYKKMLESFRAGEDSKYKAYFFKINGGEQSLVYLEKGNSTRNSLGSSVKVITSEEAINVSLKLYY